MLGYIDGYGMLWLWLNPTNPVYGYCPEVCGFHAPLMASHNANPDVFFEMRVD